MGQYPLVVVPEQTHLTPVMATGLAACARAGGWVLMSGAHLAGDCPDLVGASPLPPGEGQQGQGGGHARVYLPVGRQAVPVSGPWQPVRPYPGTEVLTCLLRQQEVPKDATDQAAVTRRRLGEGSIVAVHGPIFRDYCLGHYPLLRRFLADLVGGMNIAWTVEVDAPPRLEVVLRRKNGRLLVNLINRGAGEMLSSQRVVVAELPPVQNVALRIRRDRRPRSVSVAPDAAPAEWSFADGAVTVKVAEVPIHVVVAVE
jgi:hypothetical protein